MNTFGETIQRLQSAYSKGVQSVDSRLTPQHIYSALKSSRSTLINQMLNKRQYVDDSVYQLLPCVELIRAPVHECPCVPENNIFVLRSKFPIPKTISSMDKSSFKTITTFDGSITFDFSTYEAERYMKGAKYTSKKPAAYFRNQYLYVIGQELLASLPLMGLFEDPLEAYQYPTACMEDINDTCDCINIMDYDFPFDEHKMNALIEVGSTECLYLLKQMTEDRNANTADDTGATGLIHKPQTNPADA